DNNFYYPSSAGKGIDIYLVDEGLNTYHDDFNWKNNYIYNYTGVDDIPSHGIVVSSMAGGTIYGTAKKANIHMVAIDFTGGSPLKGFDYIAKKAKPNKCVVSLSVGSGYYSKAKEDKLEEMLNAGCIIITVAGNGNMNGCLPTDDDDFNSIPGYRKSIVVGGVSQILYGDGYYRIYYSNYGDCVDIFAPAKVASPDLSKGSRNAYKTAGGTSYSAPIVAGVVATIMSE
ncbi:hypothetical protein PIROE2DRAFT_25567, partial [Piromyces sp. E2]